MLNLLENIFYQEVTTQKFKQIKARKSLLTN